VARPCPATRVAAGAEKRATGNAKGKGNGISAHILLMRLSYQYPPRIGHSYPISRQNGPDPI